MRLAHWLTMRVRHGAQKAEQDGIGLPALLLRPAPSEDQRDCTKGGLGYGDKRH